MFIKLTTLLKAADLPETVMLADRASRFYRFDMNGYHINIESFAPNVMDGITRFNAEEQVRFLVEVVERLPRIGCWLEVTDATGGKNRSARFVRVESDNPEVVNILIAK